MSGTKQSGRVMAEQLLDAFKEYLHKYVGAQLKDFRAEVQKAEAAAQSAKSLQGTANYQAMTSFERVEESNIFAARAARIAGELGARVKRLESHLGLQLDRQ